MTNSSVMSIIDIIDRILKFFFKYYIYSHKQYRLKKEVISNYK